MESYIGKNIYIYYKLLPNSLKLKKPVPDKFLLSTFSKYKYEGKRLFMLLISRRLRKGSWGSRGPWCSFKKSFESCQ